MAFSAVGSMTTATIATGGAGMSAFAIDTNAGEKQSITAFFGSDDGFAFDLTRVSNGNETTLYQDSSFTTPVTASNDLVGGIRDESGNNNDFIQATASLKLEWISGQGVQALDSADLMEATLGAAVSDFTVVARAADVGNAASAQMIWRSINNSNNQAQLRKTGTTVQGYNVQTGVTKNISIKSSYDSSGTVNTQAYRYNDSSGEVWGQFNDETAVTNSRTPPASFGTAQDFAGTGTAGYTQPIHRIIMIKRAVSDSELETMKTMVENGWAI